ncbi:GATS protein-like 3 [Linnemannia schmuckeri]|uniref:GATS protein-like 3 n=1 Tax=Linnemannia schmuckeri TaxID=64567 RepID=A0A9P5RNP2_9FUNG|nr:GATS protein-like 3 [Linnemannia schmuckeri]
MIVDILPFRLQLASLQKKDIPRCTHQLMKLVLFPSGPRHFFSYTETDKEVSLILDEEHIRGFPANTVNVCRVIWRAVQIEPGESGLGAEEVISQVSKPLADVNVSIMQISTYDADFTLLPECDLERALECLSSIFSITNNPLEDLGLQAGDLSSWESSYPKSPTEINSLQDALALEPTPKSRQASLTSDATTKSPQKDLLELEPSMIGSLSLNDTPDQNNSTSTPATTRARHPFNVDYPQRLHITSMEESLMDVLAIKLLESIFFDSRMDRFFSFTRTDTTFSIIMDDATMSLFPDHTLNTHAGDWRLIAIGDGPLGFDECGIVCEFSKPLTDNGIGLFYLSTFSSDYIMVNDQDFELAVTCLHETAKVTSDEVPSLTSVTDRGTTLKGGGGNSDDDDEDDDGDFDEEDQDDNSTYTSDSGNDSDTSSELDPKDTSHGQKRHEDDLEIVFAEESIST